MTSAATVFQRAEAGYGCFRIPALVRTLQGTLVAFAEGRHDSGCGDSGQIDLVVKRSTDNGQTWSALRAIAVADMGGSGASDDVFWHNPTPIVDRTSGRIVLLGTTSYRSPWVSASTDDGVTWSAPRDLTADLALPAGYGFVATGPSHGVQLARGTHAGRMVAGFTYKDPAAKVGGGLMYSDDAGVTWQLGAHSHEADPVLKVVEPSVFERPDGSLYVASRNQVSGSAVKAAYAISRDAGASFSGPFAAIDGFETPRVQASTLAIRAIDTGDRYNRVLQAAPSDPNVRKNLVIRSSFDGGATWQDAVQGTLIDGDGSAYTDMAALGHDDFGILYEDWAAEPPPTGVARYQAIRFKRFTETDLGLPDGTTGPVTPDRSGQGNDAYLRGTTTPALVTGRFDEALKLDASSDDHVQPPFAESLAAGDGDFTAATWIKYGAAVQTPQALLWAYGLNSAPQFWLRAEPADNRIRGWITTANGTASVASTGAYNDDQWHHVVLQRSGGRLLLWIDGAQVASSAAPAGSVSPSRPFRIDIGRRPDGAHQYDGLLDEVRVYRRALTSAEIGSIRSRNATDAPGAVLRVPFTEPGPTTGDASGAGNLGYLRGGPAAVTGRYGKGLLLDGGDDRIHVPYAGSLDVGANDFTVMTWFKYTSTASRQALLWAYGINAEPQFWLRAEPVDSVIRGWIATPAGTRSVSSAGAFNDGQWHHVALRRSGGALSIWIDGTQVATSTALTGSVTAGHDSAITGITVGCRPDGNHHFNGTIDETRVYARALSATELAQIVNANATAAGDAVLRFPHE